MTPKYKKGRELTREETGAALFSGVALDRSGIPRRYTDIGFAYLDSKGRWMDSSQSLAGLFPFYEALPAESEDDLERALALASSELILAIYKAISREDNNIGPALCGHNTALLSLCEKRCKGEG